VPFDERLAERIRDLLAGAPDVRERRMFGGLALLAGGNLAVAASGQGGLMVRVDPADAERLLARADVVPVVMRGRELHGWLRVDPVGLRRREQLARWVTRGMDFARTLPPK